MLYDRHTASKFMQLERAQRKCFYFAKQYLNIDYDPFHEYTVLMRLDLCALLIDRSRIVPTFCSKMYLAISILHTYITQF